MKKLIETLFAAATLMLGGHVAFANGGASCTAYAGMVDFDQDKFCAFTGTSDATSTGWSGPVDCNDSVKSVNPGMTEIPGDGIDQDCSSTDLEWPGSLKNEATRQRYRRNSGAKDDVNLIAEFERCESAAECDLDDTIGAFKIGLAHVNTHLWCDVHKGTTAILGTDNVREVVTLEVASHKYPNAKPNDPRCVRSNVRSGSGTGSGSGSGGSGVSKKTVVKIVDETVTTAVGKETEARLEWQADAEEKDKAQDTADEVRDEELNKLNNAVYGADGVPGLAQKVEDEATARKAADEAEAKKRVEADKALGEQIVAVASNVVTVQEDVKEAKRIAKRADAKPAFVFDAGVGVGVIGRNSIATTAFGEETGEIVRGSVLPNGALTFRLAGQKIYQVEVKDVNGTHEEDRRVEVGGFVQIIGGSDGQDLTRAYTVGPEVLWGLGESGANLGVWAAYLHQQDLTELDLSVVSDAALVGFVANGDLRSADHFRLVPSLRCGAGWERNGTKGYESGAEKVFLGSGKIGQCTVGLAGGFGGEE